MMNNTLCKSYLVLLKIAEEPTRIKTMNQQAYRTDLNMLFAIWSLENTLSSVRKRVLQYCRPDSDGKVLDVFVRVFEKIHSCFELFQFIYISVNFRRRT